MGTRFFKLPITLPMYRIRAALNIDSIHHVLPTAEVLEFIKEDVKNFVAAFSIKDEDNKLEKLEFVAINPRKDYFVFVPPYQTSASKVTEKAIESWGIDFIKTPNLRISGCTATSHRNHEHLYPFFATNDQLIIRYEEASEENMDYITLKSIKDNNTPYSNTKFHCSGPAFKSNSTIQYKETDWAIRLFHCIKDKLPSDVTAEDGCRYRAGEFKDLQEIYSTMPKSHYYYFTAIPDIIFSKVARPTAGPSSAVIRIATEKTDIVEVKGGGHLSGPRTSGVPHALAQIVSSLHVLAAAAILKALTKNVILNNVLCKGLLINRKESMVMCKLEAKISALDSSEFTLSYSSIEMDDFHMSLKDILISY